VHAKPWMKTTAGFAGFPQAWAQILVPSGAVTNWPGEISVDMIVRDVNSVRKKPQVTNLILYLPVVCP